MCLNGIFLVKFTHVLHATAKWPSSRHRQGRYGGKLRNDGSRKRRPEMRLLFAGYSTDGIFENLKGLETKRILR